MINIIYKILPQNIISALPENNIIKKEYYKLKNVNNLKDYIKKNENKKYKILIIYTFTSICCKVEGADNLMNFLISEIKCEKGFKEGIDEIKKQNENKK